MKENEPQNHRLPKEYLDPDGKRVYLGTAVGTATGRNSTATAMVTITGTYTGYGSGMINNPSCMQIVT